MKLPKQVRRKARSRSAVWRDRAAMNTLLLAALRELEGELTDLFATWRLHE